MIHETTRDFRIRYNLSQSGLNRTRMEVMYVPPSEFNSREWEADYTPSPTQTPGFETLSAIIGILAAIFLIERGR
jgi:hypothetical protein